MLSDKKSSKQFKTKAFVAKIKDFAEENELFTAEAKHIVALSGGADSVALLRVMKKLNVDVEAATCNFHLRGEESDRDENFCISLCDSLGINIHIAHFDTKEYAHLHGVSIEMAARILRYDYFEKLRNDIGAVSVCVAHHRDDSIETTLINLIRGTGLRGLRGIAPRNGNIVRPLLCVSRREIENFLDGIGQNYVIDSTNLIDDVLRNKVRLDLIPLLETINPYVRKSIFETSQHICDALKTLDSAVESAIAKVKKDDCIDIKALLRQPSPNYLLFCLLYSYDFTPAVIRQIADSLRGESGRIWQSPTHELLSDRGRLIVRKRMDARPKVMKVDETGTFVFQQGKKFTFSIVPHDDSFRIDKTRSCACLDAGKVRFPLIIRPVKAGEKFKPFGMKGHKLVSDYLTDVKRTLFEKRQQLVVADVEGDIVWLVNERTDDRFKVTAATKDVLKILLHE